VCTVALDKRDWKSIRIAVPDTRQFFLGECVRIGGVPIGHIGNAQRIMPDDTSAEANTMQNTALGKPSTARKRLRVAQDEEDSCTEQNGEIL
jgi:hypothetical protein